jgi:hypothetical protein
VFRGFYLWPSNFLSGGGEVLGWGGVEREGAGCTGVEELTFFSKVLA